MSTTDVAQAKKPMAVHEASMDDLMKDLQTREEGMEATSEYLNLTEGEEKRAYYVADVEIKAN